MSRRQRPPRREEKADVKPKTPDGIFLQYGLNPEAWETFANQYLARVQTNFGKVYAEVTEGEEYEFEYLNLALREAELDDESEEDAPAPGARSDPGDQEAGGGEVQEGDQEGDQPPPPPAPKKKKKKKQQDKSMRSFIQMEKVKIELKEHHQLINDRERFIGDLLLHISQTSERHLREHELFESCIKSPTKLWGLLQFIHMAPTHAGNLDLLQARDNLMSCKQGNQKIEDHARRFRLLYERVTTLGAHDCGISEQVAAEMFIMSIRSDYFGAEVARWMRDEEKGIPKTLEQAQRQVLNFWQTNHNAMRALDGGTRGHGTPRGGAVYQLKHQKKQTSAELTMCPICGKRSTHKPTECWELGKFIEKHKDKDKKPEHKPPKGKKPGGTVTKGQGQAGGSSPKPDSDNPPSKPAWTIMIGGAGIERSDKIFLDTGATLSIWNTTHGLTNVHAITPIPITGITGGTTIKQVGTHPIFGEVHILKECLVNLLSFKELCARFVVHYSHEHNGFKIVTEHETIYFDSGQEGLYELRSPPRMGMSATVGSLQEADDEDSSPTSLDKPSDEDDEPGQEKDLGGDIPIEPIEDLDFSVEPFDIEPSQPTFTRRPAFTPDEKRRADEARQLCRKLGHPGDAGLIRMIKSAACLNIPVTESDVKRANEIYGPCLGCSLGKTTRKKARHIPVSSTETIQYKPEQLHADFIFLPGPAGSKQIVFLSVGKTTRLVVACRLENKTSAAVCQAWQQHLDAYRLSGAQITRVYTDNEATLGNSASYLQSREPPIQLVQHGSDMHEPLVERRVRTIKERMRAVLSELPYHLPARLYWYLMAWVIQGINIVPDSLTPEDQRSSRELVSGIKTDLSVIGRASFGDIVQYHVTTSKNFNLDPRNQVGVVVGRNLVNGVITIWSIRNKSLVQRVPFIHLTPNELTIEAINEVAKRDVGSPDDVLTRLGPKDGIISAPRESYRELSDSEDDDSDYTPDQDTDDDEDDDDQSYASEVDIVGLPQQPGEVQSEEINSSQAMVEEPRYNLRQKRGLVNLARVLSAIVFTQLTIKSAINEYGDQARTAILEEFSKMRSLNVFHPIPLSQIPKGKTIIPSSTFIKVKVRANGEFDKIKARMVAGGHRQEWGELDECSSPTAAWETVLAFWATCAQNDLIILSGDVPSAYLHASRGNLQPIYMRISRDLTEIITQANPELTQYVNKDATITVKITKAMYGLKESGLLWNQHITATLAQLGFKQLKQDRCLFVKSKDNKLIAIVVIYVDDVMVAGKDKADLDAIIDSLEAEYGSMARNPGPEFSFLGTSLIRDVETGTLHINCKGFIEKLCNAVGVTSSIENPHPSNFSAKDENSTRDSDPFLDNHAYRSLVMSLLYVAKRVRPDILYIVSHLTTRQVTPSIGDWKRAIRVLKYLHGTPTKGITYTRGADQLISTYADAAFNVHPDSKSHSGIIIFLSGGPVHFKSSKQKLVTKSTTEAELVAFDDAVDVTLWISEICDQTGYRHSKPCVMFQDNQSAIHILNQGYMTKKRGYIAVRFDYILEQLKLGSITVSYVSTKDMKADLMTKALHGNDFLNAVNQVLG